MAWLAVVPAGTSNRVRARRVRGAVALLLLLPWGMGCYTNVPLWSGAPAPGSEVTVGLSDQGRTVLAPLIGPGARRISGRVVSISDSAFTLGISGVQYVTEGKMNRWNGELVNVPRSVVSGIEERRLSRSRTWITVGIAAAAALAVSFIAIEGFGSGGPIERVPREPEPQ